MSNELKDTIIGEKPILQFGLYYNETDDLTKTYLIADDDEEEVEPCPLQPEKKALLAEYEKDIDERLEGFFVVGQRLSQIKKLKLFRGTHRSFPQYCEHRFGFGRSYAKRVIHASKCVTNLKSVPIGTVSIPANESQARPMVDLSPEDQLKVAKHTKENIGNREPTTKDFEKAKSQVIPDKTTKKTPKAKSKDEVKKGVQGVKVQAEQQAPAPLIVLDTPAAKKTIALTHDFSGVGLPTFKEMYQIAENIASLAEEQEKAAVLKVEIARLRTALHNYAQLESQREAA